MRICRFTTLQTTTPRFGFVEGESILPLAEGETIDSFPSPRTADAIPVSGVTFARTSRAVKNCLRRAKL